MTLSRKPRVWLGTAWIVVGVYAAMKSENWLLQHRWLSLILGAAWALPFWALSMREMGDSQLRTKRFHLLWCSASIALAGVVVATFLFNGFAGTAAGCAIFFALVTCVHQGHLYRRASEVGISS